MGESSVGAMIGTCSLLRLAPSCAAPNQSCCSKRGHCKNACGRELLKREFLKGGVVIGDSVHLTFLGRLVLGTKSASPCSGARMMTGKGRTYPGGVTKWQWKRRQFKEDCKLELKRITRDRKLYNYRRREELKDAETWISSLDMSVDDHATCVEDLEVGVSTGTAIQGRQNAKFSQVGWSASKDDELQQIQKVRTLLRSKFVSFSPSKHDMTASAFERLHLSVPSLRALHRVMGLSSMTPVQEATLPTVLEGKDLLIRTTGGADDIVVSLVRIQRVKTTLEKPAPKEAWNRFPLTSYREQVELAGAEAKKLLMFHTGIRMQVVMGGSNIKEETNRLRRSPCEMLVATPGRLLASLQQSAEMRGQLQGLKLLVLHDVQMLLDMGYHKTTENIISLLPRTRQTVMWSKSLSDEVKSLSCHSLIKDRAVINTFEGNANTARFVGKQEYLIVPIGMHLASVFRELKTHFEHEPKGKVVVFCQTIRTTTFMAWLFRDLGFCTREVHVRKKDNVRVAAEFRTSVEGMVLFTCGASVWGVANPDVTLVIQVGSPSAREQYVRRVTPTGPTTKLRDCRLILMPHEKPFVKQLGDLPILEKADLEVGPDSELQVQRALGGVEYQVRAKAYLAWLRYHFTKESTDSGKEKIVRLAREYASALGFKDPPMVSRKTLARLGLQNFLSFAESC